VYASLESFYTFSPVCSIYIHKDINIENILYDIESPGLIRIRKHHLSPNLYAPYSVREGGGVLVGVGAKGFCSVFTIYSSTRHCMYGTCPQSICSLLCEGGRWVGVGAE